MLHFRLFAFHPGCQVLTLCPHKMLLFSKKEKPKYRLVPSGWNRATLRARRKKSKEEGDGIKWILFLFLIAK